ncbi:MAG TPA: hypothetical protein VND93_28570 [Myxococcales bacterium]|nr:hypothetical protein [Myxococcales bacterium]
MSARAALLIALFGGGGCVPLSRGLDTRSPVEVLSIGTSFPTDTTGRLEVKLAISNHREERLLATGINWDLFFDGHHFSTGFQSLSFEVVPRDERVLSLSVPLVFRRMPLREGPQRVDVAIRGQIQTLSGDANDEVGYPFSRRLEILSDNAPVFPLPGQNPGETR